MTINETQFKEMSDRFRTKFKELFEYISQRAEHGLLRTERDLDGEDCMGFSIGLETLILVAEVNTSISNAHFNLRTYRLVRNNENYGGHRLEELKEMKIIGGFDETKFEENKTVQDPNFMRVVNKTVLRDFAPEYLIQLITVLNSKV